MISWIENRENRRLLSALSGCRDVCGMPGTLQPLRKLWCIYDCTALVIFPRAWMRLGEKSTWLQSFYRACELNWLAVLLVPILTGLRGSEDWNWLLHKSPPLPPKKLLAPAHRVEWAQTLVSRWALAVCFSAKFFTVLSLWAMGRGRGLT